MKRVSGILSLRLVICLLAVALLSATGAWAKPTTPEQAKSVVMNWLGLEALPMGAPLGKQFKEVQTFNYGGNPAYYVVYLNPAGMVFVPADDLVEPIIGFLPEGRYDPSPTNPLGALVSNDIPGRVLKAREVEAKGLEALAPDAPQAVAQRKWAWLENPATVTEALEAGLPSISDVRVASFVMSRWSQSTVSGQNCYNYYTPKNYVCGCVATAMSQLMRYWQYPTNPVVGTFTITVDGVDQSATIYGGNGSGGNYAWGSMVLDPLNSGVTLTQRQAIGYLTRDAGVSVNMDYESTSSGTDTLLAGDAFVNTFRYSNAKKGYNSGSNLPDTNRNAMVNPNLNARYPILFGITGPDGGHAIVCDGYGYNGSPPTMYHHLNMGWSGADDAWYNLPTINPVINPYIFNSVYKCVYNVYTTGSGEIIAGRVTTSGGVPISGATVTATHAGVTYNAVAPTSGTGIYAIPKVPSGTSYTVNVTKAGYTFTPQVVTTGTSTNNTTTTGNKWGIDFVGSGGPTITLNQALDNAVLTFSTSGNANWYGESATWYYGGSAAQSGVITDSQYTQLQTTVTGPGTFSFYWKVSSESGYDFLEVILDGAQQDRISGEVGWTQKSLNIPAGSHTITWKYSKDESVSAGSDCGWVDKVVYTGGGGTKAFLDAIYLLLLMN